MQTKKTLPRIIVFGIVFVFFLTACSILPRNWRRKSHFPPQELRSEDPVHQIRAIHEVVENHDLKQVPILFDLMLIDEPSVRNHAYWGVTQLTGLEKPENTKLMYHYYDQLEERKKAVETWRSYWSKKATQ